MAPPAKKRPARIARFGEPPSRKQVWRIRIIKFLFLIVFAAIGVRLVQLQVDPSLKFAEIDLSHIGYTRLHAPRGNIYDRANQLLATDVKVPTLTADPHNIDDPKKVAAELSRRLHLDEKDVYERLTRKGRRSVYIKRWLTKKETAALGNMNSWAGDGLRFVYESERDYPQHELAAHVLGFVNREQVGSAGIELGFDKYLRSTPGILKARKDAKDNLIDSRTVEYEEPEGGDDVYLTLDSVIQSNLERVLDKRIKVTKAQRGMGVVLDPRTGAILALASRPGFDPNDYGDYDEDDLKNHAITDVFEPGSSFKIVTASGALENELITPETEIDCEDGSYRIGRRVIRDFHSMGIEPFTKCFAESSNIALVKVGALLGPERLERWIKKFGFGQKTCPDLPAESPGIFRPLSEWSGYSMGSLPMGQEISVTILQLARAFSVIANGGMLVQPFVVDHVVDREGRIVFQHDSPPPPRIISESTAETMRALCHLVVTTGTGEAANIPEYRVGGKTGTAQVARKDGRGYAKGKYNTVFAGFAPLADPRLCCVIVIQNPDIRLHFGGYVCGPVFKEVVYDALRYMHVPEDPVLSTVVAKESEENKDFDADTVVDKVDPKTVEALVQDDWMDPAADLQVPPATDAKAWEPQLPDLQGMTKDEALAKLESLGLKWDVQGTGWVKTQSPAPGTPLKDVNMCRLVFSDKKHESSDETS